MAFTVPGVGGKHYEFIKVPFGATNAPGYFQREFGAIFGKLLGVSVETLIDDAVLHSNSAEEQLKLLREVLLKVRANGWRLKKGKCAFLQETVEVLGHVISENGVSKCWDKVEEMCRVAPKFGKAELHKWLGMVSFYRDYIPNYSDKTRELFKLIHKDVE